MARSVRGMQIYLVGGAVRDRLLGRPVRERDWVVTGATPEQMLAHGFRRKDPDFPVFLHPESREEYALARREQKRGQGHKGFTLEFGPDVSLAEDLARRDLTINAMAEDADGRVIDPHGGRADLEARWLRHVTPAFEEDPLRVLRLARFHAELAALGFAVAPDTLALAACMSRAPELTSLSGGRGWRETARALAAPCPAAYFRTLSAVGALVVLMPWLGPEHTTARALGALERAGRSTDDAAVRLAALCAATGSAPPHTWSVPAPARALVALCVNQPPGPATDAAEVVRWLESVDAWRRGERFVAALAVWRALTPQDAAQLERLARARDAAARVPPPPPGTDARDVVRGYREERVRDALNAGDAV
jgi:tRNA nucleotidyltransferase (CCA-adding enzyme)